MHSNQSPAEQPVFARKTGLGVSQDGLQAASGHLRCQPAGQYQRQTHDPPVRMLRANEWQRRQGQMGLRAWTAVVAVAAEPLRGWLLGTVSHQQAAERRRELERRREGDALAVDAEYDDARVED